jgi:hypothetical protein
VESLKALDIENINALFPGFIAASGTSFHWFSHRARRLEWDNNDISGANNAAQILRWVPARHGAFPDFGTFLTRSEQKKSELNEKFSSFECPWVYIDFDLGRTIFDPEANTARENNPAEHNAVHGGVIPVQTSFRKSKWSGSLRADWRNSANLARWFLEGLAALIWSSRFKW